MDVEKYFQNQRDKIIWQLKFAKENVPAYKEKFKNIDIDSIKTYSDFCIKIPITKSKEVIENPKSFCGDVPILFIRHSSSTTGKSKKVLLTSGDLQLWIKKGRLSITPYFKEGDVVAFSKRKEKHYLSGLKEAVEYSNGKVLNFDPRNIDELVYCIQKADIIIDYAEMIYYISEQLKDKKELNLNKKITLSYTGNTLSSQEIHSIKNNFKNIGVDAKIYSEYATTEIGPIGCSDSHNQKKFKLIYDDISFMETIDSESNKSAENGDAIITSLNRTGSVFIRYKIGDLGKLTFKEETPIFHFHKRKKGFVVASVSLSPEHIFKVVRGFLDQPIFCEIDLNQKGFFSNIIINVFVENITNKNQLNNLKKYLLSEIELIDDEDITSKVNLRLVHSKLNEQQIRKGYRFTISEEIK